MKAILPKTETNNATQPQNKETIDTKTLITKDFKELVTVRWYMGRSSQASVVYCCVWIHGENRYFSGKGSAGGYGYHKTSAAFQEALTSAGIKLMGSPYHGTEKTVKINGVESKQNFKRECHIGGCGDTAVDDALKAIGQALGYKKTHIVKG